MSLSVRAREREKGEGDKRKDMLLNVILFHKIVSFVPEEDKIIKNGIIY